MTFTVGVFAGDSAGETREPQTLQIRWIVVSDLEQLLRAGNKKCPASLVLPRLFVPP